MKSRLFFIISLIILFNGCRDYLNDLDINKPPSLFTNSLSYILDDTITVTLYNKSDKVVYTQEIFNFVEIKENGAWTFYASFSCNNCSELSIVKDQAYSVKRKTFNDKGTFRFVCLYSNIAGTSPESRDKLYSNEFSIN